MPILPLSIENGFLAPSEPGWAGRGRMAEQRTSQALLAAMNRRFSPMVLILSSLSSSTSPPSFILSVLILLLKVMVGGTKWDSRPKWHKKIGLSLGTVWTEYKGIRNLLFA